MYTNKQLFNKLSTILSKLERGRFTLSYDIKNDAIDLVLFNNANYGVYAAYITKTNVYIDNLLKSIKNAVNNINKS